jgi:hypothetical protein
MKKKIIVYDVEQPNVVFEFEVDSDRVLKIRKVSCGKQK